MISTMSGSWMPPSHPQSGKLHSELLVEFGLAVASAGVCLLFAFSPLSLGIVLAVVFVYITIRWTDFLFYTMLAMSPLIFWLPYNLPVRDLATIAHLGSMLGIALVRLAKRRSILQWLFGVRFNWLVCIYAVVAVISLLHSGNFTKSAQRSLLRLGSYIAFYLAIVGWLQTEDQLRKTVLALLGSTLAVSVFGIFQELAGDYTPIYWWFYTADATTLAWSGRITSFLNYSNSLAGYLNILLPLGLGCMLTSTSRGVRTLGTASTALGSIAMVLTQSRGGLLALAITFLLGIWYLIEDRKKRALLLTGYVVALPVVLAAVTLYSARLGSVDSQDTFGRMVLWISAWILFLSAPVIGIGYGNFRESFDTEFVGAARGSLDAHNLYLQLLSETGVIGFLSFCAMCGSAILQAVKCLRTRPSEWRRIVCFAALCAIVSVLIHGWVDFLFEVSVQFGSIFWAMLALLTVSTSPPWLGKTTELNTTNPQI